MAATGDKSAKRARLGVLGDDRGDDAEHGVVDGDDAEHGVVDGDDAEHGVDVGEPLPDDELEEEEEEEDDDEEEEEVEVDESVAGEVPGAAAEDRSPDAVRPKLVASDYGTNTPTSKGVRRVSLEAKGTWANIKRIKAKVHRELLGANNAGDLRKVSDVAFSTLPQQSPSAPVLNQPSVRLG